MQLARVVGYATATVKHPSMEGWRLLVVKLIAADGSPEGDPLLVVDSLGAGRTDTVLITNDGAGARQLIGHDNTPVRWTVMGIPDEQRE